MIAIIKKRKYFFTEYLSKKIVNSKTYNIIPYL